MGLWTRPGAIPPAGQTFSSFHHTPFLGPAPWPASQPGFAEHSLRMAKHRMPYPFKSSQTNPSGAGVFSFVEPQCPLLLSTNDHRYNMISFIFKISPKKVPLLPFCR